MTTNKPEVIYLIDTGDGVVWCDDRDPTGYGECDDAVKYVRGDAYEALQAECEKLRKDAERYRWLRQQRTIYDNACVTLNIGHDWVQMDGAELDEAIDHARRAEGE